MLTAYKRCHWFNSDFHSGFLLNDNQKISEISFDVNPFQINVNNNLKVITYVREANQSKPIQIKLKEPYNQSREVFNDDNEAFPIIYVNHTGVEGMNTYYPYSIARLIPQQIPRFTFRVDDNYNQFIGNSYFTSLTNGEILPVTNASSFDKYVIFRSSGSFTLSDKMLVDILIVGGGGAGGNSMGAGGGAGGVVYAVNQTLTAGTYTIIVGAGGVGKVMPGASGQGDRTDTTGGESAIMDSTGTSYISMNMGGTSRQLRAFGGGGGGVYFAAAQRNGLDGGSGGGGAEGNPGESGTGGSALQPATLWNGATYVAGGSSGHSTDLSDNDNYQGGGGGGAGGTSFNNDFRNGKTGVTISITGLNVIYAAGGGAGQYGSETGTDADRLARGVGGNNIGGQGEIYTSSYLRRATSGMANTGSGGGGITYLQSPVGTAGSGGSGVVIIRFTEKKGRIEGITAEETLIQTTNTNIPITIDSQYEINYQPPIVLPKGTYSATFANGAITFNGSTDRSYPILKDGSGVTINPIAWYQFDTNALTIDSSGNNYTLTNNGTVTLNSSDFAKGNASMSMSSSTQYLNNTSFFNITNKSWSVSFWIKKTNNGVTDWLVNIGDTNTANKSVIIYYDPSNFFVVGNWTQAIASTAFQVAGAWHHFAVTYLTGTRTITMYRNGSQIQQGIFTNEFSPANHSIFVGASNTTATTNNLKGLMDDLRVYDFVLSATQVAELYNGRLAIYNPPGFILGTEIEPE